MNYLQKILFVGLVYFSNFSYVKSFRLDSECSYNDNKDTCLESWNCGWCNISNITDTNYNDKYFSYIFSTNSSCIPIFPCFSDGNSLSKCEIKKHYMCNFIYAFINIVIIFGFFASVFMLSYTIEKLMNRDGISSNTKNSIQLIFYLIIALTIIVLFFLNQ